MSYQPLHANKLAFSFAIIWSISLLLLAWAGWLFHYGIMFTHVLGFVYLGYAPTFLGGVIGAVWGFFDFFIFIWLCSWLYNRLIRST